MRKNYGYCKYCDGYGKIAARGMCYKHYQRWRRSGDVSDPIPASLREKDPCKVDGCDKVSKTAGYCGMHYQRIQTHGDPHVVNYSQTIDFNRNQCVVHECHDQPYNKLELCYNHYCNFMYHKGKGKLDNIFDYLRLRKDNPIDSESEITEEKGHKKMNKVIVNGKSMTVSGNNISVIGDKVYVDNNLVEEGLSGNVNISFEGDLANLTTDGSATITGNVNGDVDAGGMVKCGNVEDSVDAGGSVTCLNVGGDVDAGGSVKMRR